MRKRREFFQIISKWEYVCQNGRIIRTFFQIFSFLEKLEKIYVFSHEFCQCVLVIKFPLFTYFFISYQFYQRNIEHFQYVLLDLFPALLWHYCYTWYGRRYTGKNHGNILRNLCFIPQIFLFFLSNWAKNSPIFRKK